MLRTVRTPTGWKGVDYTADGKLQVAVVRNFKLIQNRGLGGANRALACRTENKNAERTGTRHGIT